jgi:hypothetical protein
VPLLAVAKEISLEDVRLGLEKMPDRFCEHPHTALAITNLSYVDAPQLIPGDPQTAKKLNWQTVRLTGESAYEYVEQIEALGPALSYGWQTKPSPTTGNPVYVRPSVLVIYRADHEFVLDSVIPKPGDTLAYLEEQAAVIFPQGVRYDFKGESRQYKGEGAALEVTFFLSLLIIYLVLAAQFESWRDPFVILMSVPLSIAGAMAFLFLGFASINIYTQVGLITLIGLVAKNGILIVEFSNQLREREGLSKLEAVEQASAIRLRPILMTTVSMLVAMIPLLIASGPGAVSRFDIGLVIVTGLGIGTLFTLFVVPAFYLLLSPAQHRRHGAPDEAEAEIQADAA